MKDRIASVFKEKFGVYPAIFRSPGRINILGEHTDYSEGFVLPAAIDKYVYTGISKREDDLISLFAIDFNESFTIVCSQVNPALVQWPNYILGVVDQLQKSGHDIKGFNMVIAGDIPVGAGLSSSAAVVCSAIFALNKIFEIGLSKMQMARLAQKAEHLFAGVNCGIMDQFTSLFGKKDQVIKLDCRSMDHEYIPLTLSGYKIVLFNTNITHSLASSAYNTRRQECEAGVSIIKQFHPFVNSLRDADLEMLKKHVKPVDEQIYKRCKYVVEENSRVQTACENLKRGDIKALGQIMYETHHGLQYYYEVSCKELDFLVDYTKNFPGVAGARMVGGGFGGCTINLVKNEIVEKLISDISFAYRKVISLSLTAYRVSAENGTEACLNVGRI